METHKVINLQAQYESAAMTTSKALTLYDSLGGASKGYKIVKA